MKKFYFLILFLMSIISAQARIVTGTVTDRDEKEPIIGASIIVKGTTTGTITDFDGNFSIDVPEEGTLIFSYIGYKRVEVTPTTNEINVVMESEATAIEEFVVTAQGVVQEKKRLNFAVQNITAENLIEDRSSNFVSSLQGKVAGLSVTTAGGSPNSGSQVTIRGISSINSSQSNEPLFIIDGIQMSGGAQKAADINPNDIENITVLKGAAASALYGQEAANGAIMITTKTGKKGAVTVSGNAMVQIDNAVRAPEIQSTYGPGSAGFYKEQTMGGWGAPIQAGEKTYDNVGNFFKTGIYQKYDASVSGGSENFNGYASLNYSNNQGIVVDDYNNKLGVMLKGSYTLNEVTVSAMTNIVNSRSRSFGSNMGTVYNWAINDDITNYKNEDGSIRRPYVTDIKQNSPISPLWSRYMDDGETKTSRYIIQGSLNWKPKWAKGLEFTGRASYDQTSSNSSSYSTPRWSKSDFTEEELKSVPLSVFGSMSNSNSTSEMLLLQALGNYKITFADKYELSAMVGFDAKDTKSTSSTLDGRDFLLPGDFYSVQNLGEMLIGQDISMYRIQRRMWGVYGELRFDYNGIAQVSATIRNDNSSTLDPQNNSYIYPSFTGGLIFSELFNLSNSWFSYGKLRGNWAMVGKDASPYLMDRKYKPFSSFPDGGYAVDPTSSVAQNLKPEISTSWEIGLDLRFFNSKTKLDVAYYSTQVDNQIVTVRVSPSSGHILQTRNEGSIRNQGIEATLEQEIMKTKNIRWNAQLNFGLNRGTVVALPDGIVEIQGTQYGDIFPTAYLGGSTQAISGKDYRRTEDGRVLVTEDGYPIIDSAKGNIIGNREPDCLLGLSSTFNYKGLSLGFLVDARIGGDVANITARNLYSNGQHKDMETYRNRMVVFNGVVQQADGSYVENTTPILFDQTTMNNYFTSVSSNFIEDGSFVRLSYVTIGYDLMSLVKKTSIIKGLKVSVTGRNLVLLTRYSGSDPQININTSAGGTGGVGIDNYNIPNTRSFNFNLNVTF